METGTYKLHPADRGFGFNITTEDSIDVKYYTLTFTLYNKVYWLELNKKVKEKT